MEKALPVRLSTLQQKIITIVFVAICGFVASILIKRNCNRLKNHFFKVMAQDEDEKETSKIKIMTQVEDRKKATNEIGKIIFSTGEVYKGEIKNGVPKGRGKFFLKDQTCFEIVQESRDKKQINMTLPDGTIYQGEINKKGQYDGQGKLTFADIPGHEGEFREGEFQNDKFLNGREKITYDSGATYEGDIKDCKFHGQGKLTFTGIPNHESEYQEGEFLNGEFINGKEKMTNNDDSVYEGEIKDGQFHGLGKMTFTGIPGRELDFQEGEFQNGKLYNGKEKVTLSSGDFYEGEIKNGELNNGYAKIIYDDGRVYEGEYKNGKPDGQGKMDTPKGVYEGKYKNGLPAGLGKFTFPDGGYYEGEFEDGLPHGKGKKVFANGKIKVIEGIFEKAVPNVLEKITYF